MTRIQRRRTPGWRMPPNAIYVGRSTVWGNPWTMHDAVAWDIPSARRAGWLVEKYREELEHFGLLTDFGWWVSEARWEKADRAIRRSGAANMAEYAAIALRGHDLVCWCRTCPAHRDGLPLGTVCPVCEPCHADALLALANVPPDTDASEEAPSHE